MEHFPTCLRISCVIAETSFGRSRTSQNQGQLEIFLSSPLPRNYVSSVVRQYQAYHLCMHTITTLLRLGAAG